MKSPSVLQQVISVHAQRGFTLIELLVVIAIIAILASMLLPGLARSTELARRMHCTNNMKQVGLGIRMYQEDFQEKAPLYLVNPGPSPGFAGGNTNYLEGSKYLGSTNVFICKSDRTRGRIPIDLGWEYYGQVGWFTTSYAYHAGAWQQLTPEGRTWYKDQVERWQGHFIVAACPWHRHLFSGWVAKAAPTNWRKNNIRDLALRHDGAVNSFVWPEKNWDEEPYTRLKP